MLDISERQTAPPPQSDKPSMRAWVSRNGSLVVATVSLFVAGLSLWYTIDAQRSDQYYREISIQPSVGLNYSTTNYSIGFENKGLGPAKIARLIINFGECADSKLMSRVEWDNSRHRAAIALYKDLADKVFTEAVWRTNRLRVPDFQTMTPDTEEMIMPGHKIDLIGMVPEQIAPFNEEMEKMDSKLRWKTGYRFIDWARSAPIAMRFCSATGKYCRMVTPPLALDLKGCAVWNDDGAWD